MPSHYSEPDTPALLIDAETVAANLRCMQALAAEHNLALRPHIKTHKMTWLAKDQLALGAVGIAVAKLSEAECMLEAGITNIQIANQVVGAAKITRLISLCQRGEISCAVDSVTNARDLNAAFSANGLILSVLIEVNSGLNRCGVSTTEEALVLAAAIDELSSLRLIGIMTHAGHAYGAASIDRVAEIGRQEGTIMADMATRLRAAGHAIEVVSVGSTPTSAHVVAIPGLTELRVGNYVFNDMMQVALGSAVIEHCALSVLASVISTPAPGRVVLDAGSKALGLDRGAHGHSLLDGYGMVKGSTLAVTRLSEEHGVIEDERVKFGLGDKIEIIPNHACSVVNLFDCAWLRDADGAVRKVPVEARGRLT